MLISSCSLDVLSSILAGGFQDGKEGTEMRGCSESANGLVFQ